MEIIGREIRPHMALLTPKDHPEDEYLFSLPRHTMKVAGRHPLLLTICSHKFNNFLKTLTMDKQY